MRSVLLHLEESMDVLCPLVEKVEMSYLCYMLCSTLLFTSWEHATASEESQIIFWEINACQYSFTRSKVTQNKINFVKSCHQWSLNTRPPDHQSNAVLSYYLVVCVNH